METCKQNAARKTAVLNPNVAILLFAPKHKNTGGQDARLYKNKHYTYSLHTYSLHLRH